MTQETFTKQVYRINCTLGMRINQNQITRSERVVTTTLGTEHGVRAWLRENEPFCGYTIYDLQNQCDATHKFLGFKTVLSRYQGGVTYADLNKV